MDIKRLRKKKRLTGRELGQIIIAIICLELEAANKGEDYPPERSELIELYQLHKDDIITDNDRLTFNVYENLFDGLINARNLTAGKQQQFFHGLFKNVHYIDLCYISDKNERVADTNPLIMTKSAYSRYMDEARERLETDKEESFFTVFYEILSYYLEDSRRAPADVKRAIRATKAEPATNPRILSSYSKYMKRGYYTLPDGRRSDQTDAREWKRAISEIFPAPEWKVDGRTLDKAETAEKLREELEASYYKKLYYNDGREPLPTAKMLFFALERERTINQLRKGEAPTISPEDFNKAESYLYGAGNFPKWEYYTDAPELSKYDALCTCLDEYIGEGKSGREKTALYKELRADYPALVSAIEALIKENIPSLSGLTISHYNKKLVTRGELARSGLADFDIYQREDILEASIIPEIIRDEEPETFASFRKSARVESAGIAVIQNPSPSQTDERGSWTGGEQAYTIDTLETIDSEENIIGFNLRELIYNSARFIYAYNALIDILKDYYRLDKLDTFKISMEELEARATAYNEYIFRFYGEVYGDEKTKTDKRERIKKLFQPLDMEKQKPTAESLEAVAETFEAEGLSPRGVNHVKLLSTLILQIMGGNYAD